MANDLFDGVQGDSQEPVNFVEKVLPKFKKEDGSLDVDGLAKGKLEADSHISRIEEENKTLRKELDSRLTYEDLLEKINSNRASASSGGNHSLDDRETNPGKQLSEQDIERKLDEMLTKKQRDALEVANVQAVSQELTRVWGSDYLPKLRARTKELNLTEDYLKVLARENPKGFLSVVFAVQEPQKETSFSPPQTQARPTQQSGNRKNWAYYQNILKTDPKRFRSPEIQKEMHDQAAKQVESFYN